MLFDLLCGGVWRCGSSAFVPLRLTTMMNRMFGKKSKKPFKSSQGHIPLGIPTNIAAGPLGFPDLGIGPKGE